MRRKWPLDSLTSRLLRMVADLKDIGKCFETQQTSVVLSLMEHNCSLLTLKAVSENKSFYSRPYYRKLEQYAPFRFSYLRTLDKRLKREYGRIKQSLKNKCSIDSLLKEGCIKGALYL